MVTAFVDMVGLLIIVPLLPFYAVKLGGSGLVVGVLVSSFSVAQLLSAPLWGRVSDRYGRRPVLLVSLAAAAAAYVVFAYADTLWLLLLSRLVQGAGGGTVGVVQAYVTDATEPENRAKSLGWLSAASSLGVMIGPALGGFASAWGEEAPGLLAAGLCLANIAFAWRFLRESHDIHQVRPVGARVVRSREALWSVVAHPAEPAARLIWIYAIGMAAFAGLTAVLALFLAARFGVDERTIGYVFMYTGGLSVLTRAGLLGRAIDWLGEVQLSRVGAVLLALGLAAMPFARGWVTLGLAVALVPLGTAFTFPCVTALLSRVIERHERGLYMGVQQTFGGVSRVVGPLWAGWAFDALGIGVPFWTGAVLALGMLLLSAGVEEVVGPKPAAATPV